CRRSFDTSFLSMAAPVGNAMQYWYMTPTINNVRFGKWDEILNAAPQEEAYHYVTVLWHWARGMAFAGKNEVAAALGELNMMQEKMKAPDLAVVLQPFNAPLDAAKIAEKILSGSIAEHQNDLKKAVALYKEANAIEN